MSYSCSTDSPSFFFHDTSPSEIYTLSLHDAHPISLHGHNSPAFSSHPARRPARRLRPAPRHRGQGDEQDGDRKSTRLNSSHVKISYAVFCLKKKNKLYLLPACMSFIEFVLVHYTAL